jgi:STE24 endopeptidase
MSADPAAVVRLVYLILFTLEFVFLQLLCVLNLRTLSSAGRQPLPGPAEQVSAETHDHSRRYARARGRLGLVAASLRAALLLGLLASGSLGGLERLSRRLPLPAPLQALLYVFAVALCIGLASLPFALYSRFVIEKRFGFNTTTPGLYLLDLFKQAGIAVFLVSPPLLGLILLMERGGVYWWLYAFLLGAAFQAALMVIIPRFIAPLFNTFSPLPRKELEQRIRALADKLGVVSAGVFVMDGSRRSTHSNAYFTGLGRARRIVLFDTLLAALPDEQIEAVLAHELGHQKLHHLGKGLAVSLTGMLAFLWLAGRALRFPPLFAAFGFSAPGAAALLVLLAYYSHPVTFWLKPLFSAWSRRREIAADRFTLSAGISSSVLSEALVKLSSDNLGVLTPHRLYSLYHDSHPPLRERLQAIAAQGKAAPNSPAV